MKLQDVIDEMEQEIEYLDSEIQGSELGSVYRFGKNQCKLTISKYLAQLKILNGDTNKRDEKLFCNNCKSGLIDYPDLGRRTCMCGALGYNVTE